MSQTDPLKQGNAAFEEEHYREALIYYNQIERIQQSAPILFKRGICYYQINQLDRAIGDFQQAWEYGYKNPEIDYYTGRIQHHKGNFSLAAKYYKNYLRETPIDNADRHRVRQLIKQCGRAIDLSYKRPIAIVEHGTKKINTVHDEIGMLESPGINNRYYYSSNRPNTSLSMEASDYDIYSIEISNQGAWSDPQRLPYAINRRDEDILLGFTQEADGLYFYRGKIYKGNICLNSGVGDRRNTVTIDLPATFSEISGDAYFYDDHLVLFAAILDGGYGGYDLYASIKKGTQWSKPINLGSQINSAYDELSPFLSRDGTELYFSSNRDESIGGLDIFYANYMFEANRWALPVNLGIPINSPGDDAFFALSSDGLSATLTSDRKNAIGGKDIYIARFKKPRGQQSYTTDYLPYVDYTIHPRQEISQVTQERERQLGQPDDTISSSLVTVIRDTPAVAITDTISRQSDGHQTPTSPSSNQSKNMTEPLQDRIASSEVVTLRWSPVFYATTKDLFNQINTAKVDQVKQILVSHPNIKVEIQCHSSEDGILEYKLYASIKRAERIEKELVQSGISDRRVSIKGFADNYPIALSERLGGDPIIAQKYNNRIEFIFYDNDPSRIQIERMMEEPIPAHSIDTKYDLYRALSDETINYKIQIAIVAQMYRGMALDLFNDATVEEDEITGLYLYTIGLYDNYAEALKTKRDIERLGITDARVLPYYNGRLLPEDQLVYYVNRYPDLKNFMKYSE